MPVYSVRPSAQAIQDLALIFDILVTSYIAFGDAEDDARERAAVRVGRIRDALLSLGKVPHQGTLRSDILPNLRSVTKDRVVFYFRLDDEAREVRVLAVFFGGKDHQRATLRRLLEQ